MKKRIAIITTHPIQYNAPLFALLQKRNRVDVKVFYTWGKDVLSNKYDPDFKEEINWDIELLQGYDFVFPINTAKSKGSHHFNGIRNPTLLQDVNDYLPNVIIVYGWPFRSHLSLMRHFKGKILLAFRGDSTLLDDRWGLKSFVRRLFLRWVYHHVDLAFYVGESNKDYYLKMGLRSSQLIWAPHAVDMQRFNQSTARESSSAQSWRKKFNIGMNDIVFLFAGKFEEKKDPLGLIQAFMDISKRSDIHLVLVGNGDLADKIKFLASRHPRIHVHPFVNQSAMPSLYAMSDVFVLPSKGPGESWGLAVNEAMASGCAIIVSDKCGCARNLVQTGVNGYLFAGGNVEALGNMMEKMIDNDQYIKKMGEESCRIIKRYNLENIATAFESIV